MAPGGKVEACIGLDEAAGRLGVTGKTLARFLRENPQNPPLFAKPGRDYIISEADFLLIYALLQEQYGKRRFYNEKIEEAIRAKLQPELPPPRSDVGSIYFVQGKITGLIKIGFAVDPKRRLKALSTGATEPLALVATIPGTIFREREIHAQFASLRERGEWFRPDRRLLAFIRDCRK